MGDKNKEREILRLLVKEFVDKGGVIQQIPEGKRGKRLPLSSPQPPKYYKQPTGARCLICDWSPTDSRSVMHPEIEEYGSNQIVIDNLTGDMHCLVCLSAAAKMNSFFRDKNHTPEYLTKEASEYLSSTSYMHEMKGFNQVYDPILGHIAEGSKKRAQASAD